MPLSDRERKLLAEMEAAFEQEDPGLVSTLTGKARTKQASRAISGVIGVLLGIVILFAGLISKIIALGLVGFVVALAGAFFLVTNLSALVGIRTAANRKPKTARKSWVARLEERWERRNFQ